MRKALALMPTTDDVSRLLRAAAQATTYADTETLVVEAEKARGVLRNEAAATREVDLGAALVRERMAPVPVYSRHTAATDWIGELDTTADTNEMQNTLIVEATLWYSKLADEVKGDAAEFAEQVKGHAAALSGGYGDQVVAARQVFAHQVQNFRSRDLKTGAVKESASTIPQVGEQGYPDASFATGNYDNALPGEDTTSDRAPQIQELENNTGPSASQDVTPINDPGLGKADPSADEANGDVGTRQNGSGMNNTARSAVRHEGYSGLDQIQQTVDPSDTHTQPTPLNTEVAYPWVTEPGNVDRVIQQTEQQIAERDQRKGASRHALAAAREVYERAMKQAGYDASGWAGDMGAGGNSPGPQDTLGAPGHNLGEPDPVYGYGGDQGDRQLKPYGADEANDYTNDKGMDYQPGEDTHADVGARQEYLGSKHREDPEIQRALKFIAQRERWLGGK